MIGKHFLGIRIINIGATKESRQPAGIRFGVRQRHVTDALNTCLGQNVNTFINSYRIEAVKEEMARPESAGTTILDIALAAGFNSKSPFNEAFRKQTGMTPSAWREAGNSRQ